MDPRMDLFTFRKHLYWISNQLSSQEVENLKFMCNDLVPRRQLERLRSGFDLFCVLEGKDLISTNNVALLEEILETVGKDHLVRKLLNGQAIAEVGPSNVEPSAESEAHYNSTNLKTAFKFMLVKVGDELMEQNVRDIALFFQDPKSLSLQDIEHLRSASRLFQKLEDQGIIGPTKLEKLRATLDVIGRKDVCKIVDDYLTKIQCPAPTQVSQEGAEHFTKPVEERQGSSLNSTQISTGAHSFVSQSSNGGTSLSTLSSNTSSTTGSFPGSGPPTSLQSYSTPPSLQGGTPVTHPPMTLQSDSGNKDAVFLQGQTKLQRKLDQTGDTQEAPRGRRTEELLHLVSDRDETIEQQKREIQQLESKLAGVQRQEREYQHEQVQLLQDDLRKKIGEVNSLQQETSRLRDQLLRADDVPLYNMTSDPHGIAVIIVNDMFNPQPYPDAPKLDLSPRKGAQRDFELFSRLFRYLRYEVTCYRNVTAMGMGQIMEEVAAKDHSNYDSFVCCVSTHGDEDMMYGSDSVGMKRTEFDEPIKRCVTLQQKPKMFFIQACRVSPLSHVGADCHSPREIVAPKLPPDTDFFIANATTARNASYRSPDSGSWFVTALYEVFMQYAQHWALYAMMNEVNTLICDTHGLVENQSRSEEVAQCAEWTSSFRKGVRFFHPTTPSNSTTT